MSIVFNPKQYEEKAKQVLRRIPQRNETRFQANMPLEQQPLDRVEVAWFPQDPLVGPPQTTLLPNPIVAAASNPDGLSAPRFRILDPDNPSAEPGKIYQPGDPRFDQLMALAVGEKLLNLDEQILSRTIPWAFNDPQLWIFVHKDEEPNSGYTRGDPTSNDPNERHGRVELDYFPDALSGKMLQSSESTDIISHECTHAITDGIRPLYSQSFSPDSQAYHEGNADIGAMIQALNNPDMIEQVIQQTGGDLSQYNIIADIGEEFGKGMMDDGLLPNSNPPFIRSAFSNPNIFKYTHWKALPFLDPTNGLGSEPHSFSRIWSGAWYDALIGIYNMLRSQYGMSAGDALYQAGHVMADVEMRALEFAPVGDMRFSEMALACLKAVKTDFGESGIGADYRKVIEQAFLNRNILTQDEIQAWNQKENALPQISLDASVKDGASAQSWLQKNAPVLSQFNPKLTNVLPKLQFQNLYTNRLGETFLNFTYKETVAFQDSDFNTPELASYKSQFSGTNFDVWGGLTIGFDASGKLFALTYDDIPQTEISDDKAYLLMLISQGLIQGASGVASHLKWKPGSHYTSIHIRGTIVKENGKRYIRRIQALA